MSAILEQFAPQIVAQICYTENPSGTSYFYALTSLHAHIDS